MPNLRVTIEVEGPADEVAAWLSQLPQGSSGARITQKSGKEGAGNAEVQWNAHLAQRLVRQVSERAKEALFVIASEAPEVDFDIVRDRLGVDGEGLGGILASFGFAERKGIPRPYVSDRARRVYVMDPEVAQLILDALEVYG